MFISKEYVEKVWPRFEARTIRSRAAQEHGEYVLPVRFDDTPVPGLSDDLFYLPAEDFPPAALTTMIAQKSESSRSMERPRMDHLQR